MHLNGFYFAYGVLRFELISSFEYVCLCRQYAVNVLCFMSCGMCTHANGERMWHFASITYC